MRRPTRQFVVEVKSSRRRITREPASIWGDIDLKAVAREAEAETADFPPSNLVAVEGPAQAAASEPQVLERSELDGTAHGVTEGVDVALSPEAAISTETGDSQHKATDVIEPSSPAERTPHSRKPRSARKQAPGRDRANTMLRNQSDAETLASLTGENHRLKVLLRDKYLRENALLRDLLERHSRR